MRPRELTLRGFRSYRDEVTFDLRGRHLVGIAGPIGAGKSTILDGVAFALFGKTPRVQRETKTLIHQLADSAHVQLVFEVDGVPWRATRALKRRGQGQVQLVRLTDDGPDAEVLETVVMDKPVRERVEQLLGMDFDTFGRSVLLAQNRFAEFLLAADGPRNAVLKGVFGYERFDAALAVTRERVVRDEVAVAALDADGARLLEARAELDDARGETALAGIRRDALLELRPQVEEIDRRAGETRERGSRAQEELARLERVAAGLPEGAELSAVIDAAGMADEAVAVADRAAAEAEASRHDAESARDAAADRVGDLQAFADLVAQLHAQADAVTAAVAARERAAAQTTAADDAVIIAGAARDAAEKAAADAESVVTEAVAALAAADDALHAARHGEMALELRRTLVAGEPCPVCSQVVATKPRAAKSAGVRQAERDRTKSATRRDQALVARDRSVAAAAEAAAAATAAVRERDRMVAAAAEAEAAARDAEAALATTQSALVDQLGDGDPGTLLEERRRELRDAEEAARAAAEHERAARARLDEVRRVATEAGQLLAGIRERLAAAQGSLGVDPVPGADVGETFERLMAELETRTVSAAEERDTSASALREIEDSRLALLRGADLPPGADVGQATTEAQIRAAQADERVSGLERILADGEDLDARMTAARERLALARRLREDLQPSKFLAWLLDEERAALAEIASTHFEELTDGDFRFSDDGSFRIVDVNGGGSIRGADSLSGGETFLASLALALALAEMVTRGGGRLDSFFLDEGFGSLDPEHIERAMRGIEHLIRDSADRLVILVSHVEQMHELLEDLIVLEKDEAASTTRVLRGARPA
jgi:DNA repair protein SbcC/Rad50